MRDATRKTNHKRRASPAVQLQPHYSYVYLCALYGIPISGPYNPGDWASAQYSVGSWDYHDGLGVATMPKKHFMTFMEGYRHAVTNISHFVRSLRHKGRYYEPAPTRMMMHVFADMTNALCEANRLSADVSLTGQKPNDELNELRNAFRGVLEQQMDFASTRPFRCEDDDTRRDVAQTEKELTQFIKFMMPMLVRILVAQGRTTKEMSNHMLKMLERL
jgi:hypothetical protein